MSVFRRRRFWLLLLVVFISVMLVWRPWGGLGPQARGLNLGLDIAGGSRGTLWLEVSHVTISTSTDNLESSGKSIQSLLRSQLDTTVNLIAQHPAENRIVVEVGKFVTRSFIQGILGQYGDVIDVRNFATASTQAETISKIQARVDPYGLLGTRFRTLGENYLLCETTRLDDRTRELLTKQGRLEVFVENHLVITDADIESFHAPVSLGVVRGTVYSGIPVKYTEGGQVKIEAAVTGGASRAGVVYLDRPSDAILIFSEEILDETSKLSYDNSARRFNYVTEGVRYPLLVSAVGTSGADLSPDVLGYLADQAGTKQRIILLGSVENFAQIIEEIPAGYRIENITRLKGETADKWIKRACGLISDLPLNEGIQKNVIVIETSLQNARDIRAILFNKLPAELSIVDEAWVKASFGDEFEREVLAAGGAALAGVFLLVYFRYRRWKLSLALIGMIMCEFVITLGAISALGLTLGLPELAGLLLVVSTGIDHMLIVADEMLKGVAPQANVSVGWRASRALAIVYTAVFLIIAAMAPIGLLGFAALRGFVLIAVTGTILALLFTRPFYAKIIDSILIR
jgi:preprotein translocase subunit SecD